MAQMPHEDTLLTFVEAQSAVAAINKAWEDAVDEVISDPAVRMQLHAACAGNVFQAMLERINKAQKTAEELDSNYNPVVESPDVALRRIFGAD